MSCGDRLKDEIRKAGYRVTPQRAVILETVAHMEGHRSAHEVYEHARERLPGLNLATVYRTLDTLHHAGLIDLFSVAPDSMRFSLHDASNAHAHLYCKNCGVLLEVDIKPFKRLATELEHEIGFVIDSSHMSFQGLCHRCREDGKLDG